MKKNSIFILFFFYFELWRFLAICWHSTWGAIFKNVAYIVSICRGHNYCKINLIFFRTIFEWVSLNCSIVAQSSCQLCGHFWVCKMVNLNIESWLDLFNTFILLLVIFSIWLFLFVIWFWLSTFKALSLMLNYMIDCLLYDFL